MVESLTSALEREHHEIDAGIESFLEGLQVDESRADDLSRAIAVLRRHIYLEEEFLFPPLRAAGMLPPVLVMLREHGEIWRLLDAIESLGLDAEPQRLRSSCAALIDLLAGHNAKEEPIIYPQGDAVLSEEAKRELHTAIDDARMPDGWVCAQA